MLFNGLSNGRAHFRHEPFKPLVRSPTGTRREGKGRKGWKGDRKEEEITIERFHLSFQCGFRAGSDCESLAEILATNFAQQFEPDGTRSGRSINDQAPEAERDCHVST